MNYTHEVIFCIVNSGFAEAVMDAAREVGARGGTVLHASGTANAEAEKIFGVTIQPEKEIVMILVESEVKEKVLHALYHAVGLKTAGQGIAFALPGCDVVGSAPKQAKQEEATTPEKTEKVKEGKSEKAPSQEEQKSGEDLSSPKK